MRHRKIHVIRAAVILTVAIALTACVTNKPKYNPDLAPPYRDDVSLIIGYIDMDEAVTWLTWMDMERSPRIKEEGVWGFKVKDGIFYRDNVPPGVFKITDFGGYNPLNGINATFQIEDDKRFVVKTKKSGINFIGSFKYKNIRPLVGKMTYELVPVSGPSEREILEKLLPHAKEQYWDKIIRKRLSELSK